MFIEELKEKIRLESIFPEITEDQAMAAYMGALIDINDEFDTFYYFACMNLLNAYVKKDSSGEFIKRYQFKHYVASAIGRVIAKGIPNVLIYIADDVVYISIFEIQFSFHNIFLSKELKDFKGSKLNKFQEWSGIKLQPPASLIFTYARNLRANKSLVNHL